MAIQNPVTWLFAQFEAAEVIGSTPADQYFATTDAGVPPLRRISTAQVWQALRLGWADTGTGRADLLMLWLIYPMMALYIAAADYYGQLIPLLLPVAAGFTLVGPLFAVGLYEMSRRHEISGEMHWTDGFKVLRSPSIGGIVALGITLIVLFAAWLAAATLIYRACLGDNIPPGWAGYFIAAFTTAAGWEMLALGALVGGVFALLALVISSISFPLLLDRPVKFGAAIRTSVYAMRLNPVPLLLWGLVVAAGLVLGSIPVFAGLIVVLPILGHGTWHLYRAMVPSVTI